MLQDLNALRDELKAFKAEVAAKEGGAGLTDPEVLKQIALIADGVAGLAERVRVLEEHASTTPTKKLKIEEGKPLEDDGEPKGETDG